MVEFGVKMDPNIFCVCCWMIPQRLSSESILLSAHCNSSGESYMKRCRRGVSNLVHMIPAQPLFLSCPLSLFVPGPYSTPCSSTTQCQVIHVNQACLISNIYHPASPLRDMIINSKSTFFFYLFCIWSCP